MKTVLPYQDDSDPKSSQLPSDVDLTELGQETGKLSERIDNLIKEAENQANKPKKSSEPNAAADLVRAKVQALYEKEPPAREEAKEAELAGRHRSPHQEFIYKLTTSGKSLADIQTEWHNYYTNLPDDQKHQVWHEFYEMHGARSKFSQAANLQHAKPHSSPKAHKLAAPKKKLTETRTVAEIKQQIVHRATAGGRLSAKHHIKSLAFGLGMGALVLFFVLFGFFNERFIAPFISPSRNVGATPIIPTGSNAVGPEPKILIPKINVEVPVVYDLGTTEEAAFQTALEDGVVHYDGTAMPGQTGNVAIFGHSSNNILNKGKYKFAFVLLKRLEAGDLIYVQKGGVRYTYQVYDNRVIPPTDVSVLGPASRPNTLSLITCDPPGTSINRRVVVAEQISPDPAKNTAASQSTPLTEPEILPSNSPSLWQRITDIF